MIFQAALSQQPGSSNAQDHAGKPGLLPNTVDFEILGEITEGETIAVGNGIRDRDR